MNNLKDFLKITIFVLVVFWLIKFFDISYPLTITTKTQSSELAVVGEGKIEVSPDIAYLDAGITVDNQKTVQEVQEKIHSINNKIIASLKNLGIDKKNIKTLNYSIYPNYKYENNTSSISGYNGNATIQVKIKNLQLVSQVISSVSESGANQIHGLKFGIEKPEVYREKSREEAIKNAKIQAEKLAKNLGIKLGKITNIVENSDNNNLNNLVYNKIIPVTGGENAEKIDIESGTKTVSSVVILYFEKK
ncbi:MAG: SIMPL domain-containing protein [Patescibacteria group bacterium]|nr:SIMPL domain-containing protein [Patescibacteria group bacterium]